MTPPAHGQSRIAWSGREATHETPDQSLTAGASSIEFVAVFLERKPLLLRDVVLSGLDLFGFEFHNLPTTGTNKMIVVLTVRFVTRESVIEVPFISQACID